MRQVRSLLSTHAKTRGAPEESAQYRSGLQLRRVRQDVSQPDEHSSSQTDPHRAEDVCL